jgi:hypothetical protein
MAIMSRNVGAMDRLVRVLLGASLLALGWSGAIGGTLGLICRWLGFVPIVTAWFSWCPLYAALGIRTRPMPD